MKISQARKILGKESITLNDVELQKELDRAAFIAEIVLREYKRKKKLSIKKN